MDKSCNLVSGRTGEMIRNTLMKFDQKVTRLKSPGAKQNNTFSSSKTDIKMRLPTYTSSNLDTSSTSLNQLGADTNGNPAMSSLEAEIPMNLIKTLVKINRPPCYVKDCLVGLLIPLAGNHPAISLEVLENFESLYSSFARLYGNVDFLYSNHLIQIPNLAKNGQISKKHLAVISQILALYMKNTSRKSPSDDLIHLGYTRQIINYLKKIVRDVHEINYAKAAHENLLRTRLVTSHDMFPSTQKSLKQAYHMTFSRTHHNNSVVVSNSSPSRGQISRPGLLLTPPNKPSKALNSSFSYHFHHQT